MTMTAVTGDTASTRPVACVKVRPTVPHMQGCRDAGMQGRRDAGTQGRRDAGTQGRRDAGTQ